MKKKLVGHQWGQLWTTYLIDSPRIEVLAALPLSSCAAEKEIAADSVLSSTTCEAADGEDPNNKMECSAIQKIITLNINYSVLAGRVHFSASFPLME